MTTKVTLSNGTVYDAGAHQVYWRAEWGEDWEEDTGLQCLELVWSCAPTIPTATLSWRYGLVKQPTANSLASTLKRLDLRRVFVKVTVSSDTENDFAWYGVCEINDDIMDGARITTDTTKKVTARATGQQVFTCYGMVKLLADHDIVTSMWGEDIPPETVYTIDRALTFNKDGVPNRSPATVGGEYVFHTVRSTSEWWSTKTISEYLLRHQTPKDESGGLAVPFNLSSIGPAPDWDRPIVEQEHATTFSILEQLFSRKKLHTWWVDVVEDEAGDQVYVYTNSLLDRDLPLTLSWASPLEKNVNQLDVIYDEDSRTSASLRDDGTRVVDQVVVFGEYRRSVCTLSITDGSLYEAWTAGSSAYNEAASITEGYDELTLEEQQRKNREVRSFPRFEHVYAHFGIAQNWDCKVIDGLGGTYDATERDVFVKLDGSRYDVFPRGLEIDHRLPLVSGVNYADERIGSGSATTMFEYDTDYGSSLPEEDMRDLEVEFMGPIVAFKRPDDSGRWVLAEQIGALSDLESDEDDGAPRFSCSVRVADNRRGIVIRVHGEIGQQAIASDDAGFLDADESPTGYSYSNGKMLATVAIRDDRRVKVEAPETPRTHDAVRRLYIDAGEGYTLDYIVPGTVVGIDEDGTLTRSTGGYIPFPGADTDQQRLKAIAEIAARYYTEPHFSLSLETYQPTKQIGLGDLIATIGSGAIPVGSGHRREINSPVSQITLSLPDDGSPIVQRIDTHAAELDPMQLGTYHGRDDEEVGETEPRGLLSRRHGLDRNAPDDVTFEPFKHLSK